MKKAFLRFYSNNIEGSILAELGMALTVGVIGGLIVIVILKAVNYLS